MKYFSHSEASNQTDRHIKWSTSSSVISLDTEEFQSNSQTVIILMNGFRCLSLVVESPTYSILGFCPFFFYFH